MFNLQHSYHMCCWRLSNTFIRQNKERVLLIHLSVNVAHLHSVFYLTPLTQSFRGFEGPRFTTRASPDTGASDVRLAPDRVRECEDRPRGRALAHRLGLILTGARARQYTHSEQSSALGIVEGAQRRETRQAQTPSRTEQRFVWRPGPDPLKPCWIDCGEATPINGLALKSFQIYWKGARDRATEGEGERGRAREWREGWK